MSLRQLKQVENGLTPQEICQAVGINYGIEKKPLSYFNNGNHQVINGKYAVVNEKGNVLSICSEYWDIFQNLDLVTTAYETFGELGLNITHAGEFDGGKRIACVGDWNRNVKIGVGDEILGKVILIGSHEVGIGHELRIYWERLVCKNGMTQRVKSSTRIFGHTTAGVKALTEALTELDNLANNFQENAQTLANLPITEEEAMMILIKEFGKPELSVDDQPKVVKSVLKLFSGGAMGSELITSFNTAWGLLNSLTEYYSHHTNPSDRLKSLVSGCYGSRINQLQNTLLNYSNKTFETQRVLVGVRG